jgi:hypothetical protein
MPKSETDQPPLQRPLPLPGDVTGWMDAFAERIRRVDFEAGRRLFHDAVFGFGTKAKSYSSLDEWHHEQWINVWPHTKDFKFIGPSARLIMSEDRTLCVVVCEWQSAGIRPDETTFARAGRATLSLIKATDSEFGWLGLHCHFSMSPHTA